MLKKYRPAMGYVVGFVICFSALIVQADEKGTAVKKSPPNVVLFFVDDLGWSDLGFRNPKFETPNIDELAHESLNFPQAYIASPTCSPSRATLVTGQHPARLQLVRHIPHKVGRGGFTESGEASEAFHLWETDPAQFPSANWLDLEHTTYAEALKGLGYYNVFVGKWHLGHEPYHPIHQGFDQQIGTTNWGHPKSYYPPYFRDSEVFAEEKERYLTDKLTDEAVAFIDQYDREKPFMLSFWYYSVHKPHVGREDLVEKFEQQGLEGNQAHYAAMVTAVDESVGRVRAALKEKGIEKETIVIFLSDQGGYFENPPFHGEKTVDTLYEGGSRVPFFFYWPGVTKAAENPSLVQSTDLFPTLVEIAGGNPADYEHLDGVSLASTIHKNERLKRGKPLFGYRAYEDLYASVRQGKWKLLAYRSGTVKLYNIAEDIGETNDLAAAQPAIVKKLTQKLVRWEREMGVAEYSGVQDVSSN
ncbi:Choline-sulfatase [Planctomycetales bacterium 10988]|nr:Choline-sulfatase [Planctomycetales bacterium 10988]